MASYHVREREPLLDQQVQQMLTRRGRQILGLCLLTVAVAFGCMLASYSPNDAGWMVETSGPVQNLFGPFGAAVASMMMVILGYGAWTIMLIFGAWGFRTLADLGSERAIGRLTFGVIAVALAAVFVACYEPAADWPHAFGFGGLFGDTVLAALLQVLPEGLPIGLNFLTVTLGFSTVASLLFVMGCTISELGHLSRLSGAGMLSGFGVLWLAFARVLGYGADQMRQSAIGSRSRLGQRPEAQTGYDAPPLGDVEDWGRPQQLRAHRALEAVASQMPDLIRRGPQAYTPSLDQLSQGAVEVAPDDHIKNRISAVIRARGHATQPPVLSVNPRTVLPEGSSNLRGEPILTRSPAIESQAQPAVQTAFPAWKDEDDHLLLPEHISVPVRSLEAATGAFEQGRVVMTQGLTRAGAHPSRRASAEAQPCLAFDDVKLSYELPPLSLLASVDTVQRNQLSNEALEENARMLESVLDDYGVKGEIVSVRPGPVVTMYELEPAPGLRASRVIGLSDDIAR